MERRLRPGNAGIVDENVQPSGIGPDLFDRSLDRLVVGHVEFDRPLIARRDVARVAGTGIDGRAEVRWAAICSPIPRVAPVTSAYCPSMLS